MQEMLSYYELFGRLVLASVFGGLIGFERERLSWFAGLRTHMLVCVGAALIMIVSQYGFSDVLSMNTIVLDPSRVSAQVVSGIGFLGAGTILFWKNTIRGLTTAASLWAVAAVGLATGSGLYFAAFMTTILILLILAGLKPFEKHFFSSKVQTGSGTMKILSKAGIFSSEAFVDIFHKADLSFMLTNLKIENAEDKELVQIIFESTAQNKLLRVVDILKKYPGIESVEIVNDTIPKLENT